MTAIQLKKRVTGTCILSIVISKLGHWQEPSPVILFEIDKGSEVGFHRAILPLGLVVGLRVEGGGQSASNTEEVAKQ